MLDHHLLKIFNSGDQIDFKEKIRILDFLPKDQDSFFRYHGSLTTPPCYESVTWTVFQKPITVSTNQVGLGFNIFEFYPFIPFIQFDV